MSVAMMEPLQSARSASVGRRSSLTGATTAVAGTPTVDEIIEDRRRYPDGTVQVRKYIKGRFLGKGGFARCYQFTSLSKNRVMAGKVVLKSSLTKERAKQKLLAEIKIHRDMSHPCIVRFETFFEDKVAVYILLELCTNQTMMELVKQRKRLSEPETAYFMLQLLDATRYMHAHNIIHRDLKLGNLFLSKEMGIKLGDFGLAARLDNATERRRTICGTPNYIAPEILNKKSGGHSFEVDIWSLGVILYTMLVGKPPFETADIETTYKRIRANSYSFPPHIPLTENAKHLVQSILQTDPEARPSLEAILSHPFFTAPNVWIPLALPSAALTAEPLFRRDEMRQGSVLVADMLARPIGDLRQHIKTGASENVGIVADIAPAKEVASLPMPQPILGTRSSNNQTTAPMLAPVKEAALSSAMHGLPLRKPAGDFNIIRADSLPTEHAARIVPEHTKTLLEHARSVPDHAKIAPEEGSARIKEPSPPASSSSALHTAATGGHRRAHSLHPSSARSSGPTVNDAVDTESVVTGPLIGTATLPSGGGPMSVPPAPGSAVMAPPGGQEGVYTRARAAAPKAPVLPSATADPFLPTANPLIGGDFDRLPTAESRRTSGGGGVEKDKDVLAALHYTLAQTIDGKAVSDARPSSYLPASSPGVWVTTWVDYTSKYGLGYMLSNGSVGVYFNDSTKIILASDGRSGEYIDRTPTSTETGVKAEAPRVAFDLNSFPPELNKKVTLLKHFRGYLLEQYKSQAGKCDEEARSIESGSPSVNIPFVKKWVKTRHAILFRMSNRVVQINFFDHTAIVLSSDSKSVSYVNKDGSRSHHDLNSIMSDNRPDIAKRLKYTKDILSQLISGAVKGQ